MKIHIYLMFITIIITSIIFTSVISVSSDQENWFVIISIYSGRMNPHYKLENNEVNILKNMIDNKMKQASRVASDDKNKHQGRKLQYTKYHSKSFYHGVDVVVKNKEDERIEMYEISGKFLRKYYDEGYSSKLYKLKNKDIEEYLIQLGIEKGAIDDKQYNIIDNDIKKRKED